MSSKAKPALQTQQIRQLIASELDAVAGGVKQTPPVCKPIYPKPGSVGGATA